MHEPDIRAVGHHGGQYKMKYLYLDTETDKVILIAKKKIEDQLDNIYHNGVDAWKADIKAIKDANPKENN